VAPADPCRARRSTRRPPGASTDRDRHPCRSASARGRFGRRLAVDVTVRRSDFRCVGRRGTSRERPPGPFTPTPPRWISGPGVLRGTPAVCLPAARAGPGSGGPGPDVRRPSLRGRRPSSTPMLRNLPGPERAASARDFHGDLWAGQPAVVRRRRGLPLIDAGCRRCRLVPLGDRPSYARAVGRPLLEHIMVGRNTSHPLQHGWIDDPHASTAAPFARAHGPWFVALLVPHARRPPRGAQFGDGSHAAIEPG